MWFPRLLAHLTRQPKPQRRPPLLPPLNPWVGPQEGEPRGRREIEGWDPMIGPQSSAVCWAALGSVREMGPEKAYL